MKNETKKADLSAAFEQCKDKKIATTLLDSLSPEQRLDLLTAPGAIAKLIPLKK